MNITKVVIRNFKRFGDVTFDLDGHVVVAGPNNSGKTTLLQAIATWHLALTRWRELGDYQRHGGRYTKAPIARQAFSSVPLRAFDLLWHKRSAESPIEIEVTCDTVTVPVQIISDSSEQVYVRPLENVPPDWLKDPQNPPTSVFVPAMTGLSTEEPVYQPPKIAQLLGQGKPGDVLRNLLVEANHDQDAWERLTQSIERMFGYRLQPPNTDGPNIIAEYRSTEDDSVITWNGAVVTWNRAALVWGGASYDIASAGSGFLQVLMLLTFLHARPGTVLLLDEPDAHLHVILQDGIYSELRAAARKSHSQLIVATHSEVVINAVDPRELRAMLDAPRKLADDGEKAALIRSLSALSNLDVMQAREQGQVLYVEGHTDLNLLRTWARILGHRSADFMKWRPFWRPIVFETRQKAALIRSLSALSNLDVMQAREQGQVLYVEGHTDLNLLRTWARILGHRSADFMKWRPFWRPIVFETRQKAAGIKADDHFESLLLVQEEIRGVQVIDRAGREGIPDRQCSFDGKLLKLCWARYEIESYLVHPAVLARFVEQTVGAHAELADVDAMQRVMRDYLPGRAVDDPTRHEGFKNLKARKDILPPILDRAGLQGFDYTRYEDIAAVMRPDEIHPEITAKLDAIAEHLRL